MDTLATTVSSGLADYYQIISRKLHEWVDPLSTEQIWSRPYPYGNSIGHLLLHLTGNLSYYIGARIAETGYVRNRDLEFTDPVPKPKEDLLRNLDAAIAMVVRTIERQSPQDWSAAYSAERTPIDNRFAMVLECAGHFYHHVGQIIYLSKEIARQEKAAAVAD